MLPGASTSALHKVIVRHGDQSTVTVVMRRYVLAEILTGSPGIATRELTALQLLADSPVPSPELLAADVGATVADVPTIVMSVLEGRVDWSPRRRHQWLDQIVTVAELIHTTALPATVTVPTVTRFDQRSYQPPRWAQRPDLWERAIEIFHGPIPDTDLGFLHRDFSPGNLLWERGELTGVVDWQSGGVGPASIDISHCRLNLLYETPALADELRTMWEMHTGRRFDPWAKVMSIIGVLDHLRDRPPGQRARYAIETALTQAIFDHSR